MSRIIEKTVFQYAELSDQAKEKARDWYREASAGDVSDFDCSLDDAAMIADMLGIQLSTRAVKLYGGGTRQEPEWSYSIGNYDGSDYAGFSGYYRYAKGASKAIRQHAPMDTELHRIADELQRVQSRHFYKLVASCDMRRDSIAVDVSLSEDRYRDIGAAESDVREALRDFASWLQGQLTAEMEYRDSDEQVIESIEANEYEFDEDGRRTV